MSPVFVARGLGISETTPLICALWLQKSDQWHDMNKSSVKKTSNQKTTQVLSNKPQKPPPHNMPHNDHLVAN